MPLVTLTKVADDTRLFETPNGKFAAFKVWEGDKVAEVTTKQDTLDKRREQFQSFVGTPTELIVEEQGTFPDGSPKPPKMKIPQQGGGGSGGKRDYIPRWTDTEAGAKWADDRIDRRRALELAVQAYSTQQGETAEDVAAFAATFYTFLKSSDVEPVPAPTSTGDLEGPQGDGKADEDGSGAPASGPVSGELAYGEGASSPDRPGDQTPPAEGAGDDSRAPSSVEQRKDFRAYLADRFGTAQALLMARSLFQTQARKVPNMTVLDLDELQAVDVELKARKLEV